MTAYNETVWKYNSKFFGSAFEDLIKETRVSIAKRNETLGRTFKMPTIKKTKMKRCR